METLSKLFGSEAKVKIMRLFLFNPERAYTISDIANRVKVSNSHVRKEVNLLEKAGLIRNRMIIHNGKKKGYTLDTHFTSLLPLQNFLINVEPLHPQEVIKRI